MMRTTVEETRTARERAAQRRVTRAAVLRVALVGGALPLCAMSGTVWILCGGPGGMAAMGGIVVGALAWLGGMAWTMAVLGPGRALGQPDPTRMPPRAS